MLPTNYEVLATDPTQSKLLYPISQLHLQHSCAVLAKYVHKLKYLTLVFKVWKFDYLASKVQVSVVTEVCVYVCICICIYTCTYTKLEYIQV